MLSSLQFATERAPTWAKAWHHFALYNVECMQHYASIDVHTAQRHVAPAVMGFFRSIALGQAMGERRVLWRQGFVVASRETQGLKHLQGTCRLALWQATHGCRRCYQWQMVLEALLCLHLAVVLASCCWRADEQAALMVQLCDGVGSDSACHLIDAAHLKRDSSEILCCLSMPPSLLPTGEARQGAKLQDILRLLTLWFSHGNAPDVEAALQEGFRHVSIDTWLVVIPQVRGG